MTRAILWCAVSTPQQAEDEKESLPAQERDLRAFAEQEGWHITDVLHVPGFSRDFLSWESFMVEAQAEQIDAPARMFDHWQRRDFDVVMVRDGSRFGRTQSLFSRFVETTIHIGSRIYSQRDGFVDRQNFRMFISMGSYASSSEIDKLKAYHSMGMTGRAKRGLPVGSVVPISHILIRDENGDAVRLEVNEQRRLLFNDVAAALLEGVGWVRMEHELHTRYGHERFGDLYFYKLLHNPTFWGHSARFHRRPAAGAPRRARSDEFGLWSFDLSVAPPEGVLFYPNTHPAVYVGDQAEAVRAELRRRNQVIKGRARPQDTHLFTGLLACAECGYGMSYRPEPDWPAYRCNSRDIRHRHTRTCGQRKFISEKKVRAYVDTLLRSLLDSHDLSTLQPPVIDDSALVDSLRAELVEVEGQARRLIALQLRAPDTLYEMYTDELEKVSGRLEALQGRLAVLERQAANHDARTQTLELEDLTGMGLEAFWGLSHREINQHLHRLLGGGRLLVRDGQIIGFRPA